jgi:hypothetical protein
MIWARSNCWQNARTGLVFLNQVYYNAITRKIETVYGLKHTKKKQ